MRAFRYANFNTQNGFVHLPKPHVIHIQDILPFTSVEKLMTGVEAILAGLSAVSLISTGLWYLFMPSTALGTAVDADPASATISIIAGMGVVSTMIALPIAYLIYQYLIGEAEILQTSLARNIITCRKYQRKLFLKLIRLRSLYENDSAFSTQLAKCKQLSVHGIHTDRLLKLVNYTYAQCQLKDILQLFDQNKRSVKKDTINTLNHSLNQCFQSAETSEKNWMIAAAYGAIAGLSMTVITLTVGWGFVYLAIALKITNAVPAIGWIIFDMSTLAMGLLFCFGIGIGKHKKSVREIMRERLRNKNQVLVLISEQIGHLSTQRMVELIRKQANEIKNISKYSAQC